MAAVSIKRSISISQQHFPSNDILIFPDLPVCKNLPEEQILRNRSIGCPVISSYLMPNTEHSVQPKVLRCSSGKNTDRFPKREAKVQASGGVQRHAPPGKFFFNSLKLPFPAFLSHSERILASFISSHSVSNAQKLNKKLSNPLPDFNLEFFS